MVLHGPNLNLLGVREPDLYGRVDLAQINTVLVELANRRGYVIECIQSNHEGMLIDALHGAVGRYAGVLFNPGALSHTSIALRDAIKAIGIPTVECHVSNIAAREPFRRKSHISPVCVGTVTGFGPRSYVIALEALIGYVENLTV